MFHLIIEVADNKVGATIRDLMASGHKIVGNIPVEDAIEVERPAKRNPAKKPHKKAKVSDQPRGAVIKKTRAHLAALMRDGQIHAPKEMYAAMPVSRNTGFKAITQLTAEGVIASAGYGKYQIVK